MSKPNSFEILANSMAKDWAKKCDELISSWQDYGNFCLNVCKLDWSARRVSSRGGWYDGPGINIAMVPATRCRIAGYVFRQYEYPSYDDDPIIGGFYTNILGKEMDKPHGKSFKTPYSKIRIALLNPKLPNQRFLKEQYDNNIKRITK